MSGSTFKVLFYANGSKEKKGIVPIMGRVTINGSVAQFSCKCNILKELWDANLYHLSSRLHKGVPLFTDTKNRQVLHDNERIVGNT